MNLREIRTVVVNLMNQGLGNLAKRVDNALGSVGQDISQLSKFVAAETMRRQVLEDVLFEKFKELDREEFEKKFVERAEEYKAKMEEEAKKYAAAQEAALEAEKAKPKIYTPGGGTANSD